MAATYPALTHAQQDARCFFCGAELRDLGPAFAEHIARSQPCRDGHEAWMEHIDEDRPGG